MPIMLMFPHLHNVKVIVPDYVRAIMEYYVLLSIVMPSSIFLLYRIYNNDVVKFCEPCVVA